MSALRVLKQPGRVIGAGGMQRTVKVQMTKQVWNKYLRKNYTVPYNILVHDANGSVNEGDVITMLPELHSQNVRYTVSSIVSAFGTPVSERPPIQTQAEKEAIHLEKRVAKLQRRATRGIASAIQQLQDMGLTPPSQDHPLLGEGAEIRKNGKVAEHGREVLPQGLHKYEKVKNEAPAKKRATQKAIDRGLQEEYERQRVAEEPMEKEAGESLQKKPGVPN